MKHLKVYTEYLLESVKSVDDIYDKYYSSIPREEFDIIVVADPTTKPEPDDTGSYRTPTKMGIYCKWLLSLYASGNLNLEDIYKATEYLKLYHRFKHELSTEKRNINNIENLPELAKIVEPFEKAAPELLSSSENKKKAFIKSFENYDLYIPITYEQSRDLGRNTKWCTAADSEDGIKQFLNYKKRGILYILISKTDPSFKFQFHFEDRMFMDRYDSEIDLIKFLNDNPDIDKYFQDYFDPFKNGVIKKSKIIELEKFYICIPRTNDELKTLGIGTKWFNYKGGVTYMDYVHIDSPLYILIPKTDFKNKYGFDFKNLNFIDNQNSEINILEFLNTNPDIRKYFYSETLELIKKTKLSNLKKLKKVHNPYMKADFYMLGRITMLKFSLYDNKNNDLWVSSHIRDIYCKIYGYSDQEYKKIIIDKAEKELGLFNVTPRIPGW